MRFRAKEALLSITADCNLDCPHCVTPKSGLRLSGKYAVKFLAGCKRLGVKRVGFTGGEPFLAPALLCGLVRSARRLGFLFGRIMTNGVWYEDISAMRRILLRLYMSGYDGDISISCDAFHRQDLRKAARFINTAAEIWRRPDIVSVTYVSGARDAATGERLNKLAGYVDPEIFLKMETIRLAPVGKAGAIALGWDSRSLMEDYCAGPGNVFHVMPDGNVKPCCGYASDEPALTIGNIKRNTAGEIYKNVKRNRFAFTVFNSGLGEIRRRLAAAGFRFPGRTGNHCFLCHHILTKVPKCLLDRCLD